MSERAINLAAALAALLVLVLLFMPRSHVHISFPTTEETGPDGLYAMRRWLAESGIHTESLRTGYQHLREAPELNESGNILVVTWPLEKQPAGDELGRLLDWLRHGNQLLVLAAVNDRPAWSLSRRRDIDQSLAALGMEVPAKGHNSSRAKSTPVSAAKGLREISDVLSGKTRRYYPTVGTDLLHGIPVFSMPEPLVDTRLPLNNPQATYLPLIEDGHSVLLWYMRSPRLAGGMFLFTASNPFSNQLIGRPGHRQWLRNFLDLYLAPGHRVVFDDFHQGLSGAYNVSAFFSDIRLYQTLIVLLALWLVYIVLYATRFGPRPRAPGRAGTEMFLERSGNFLARTTARADINRQLLAGFNNFYRHRHKLPQNGEPVADLLAAEMGAASDAVRSLRTLYAEVDSRPRLRPMDVQRRITKIRREL